jgi:formate dehydrogenase maturation protein FdhE
MPTATRESTWDARIARARELASTRPAARDFLTFYAALAEYQRALAASAGEEATFDVERVIDAVPDFLDWLRRNGRGEAADSVEVESVASAFRLRSSDSRSLPAEAGSHAYAEGVTPGSSGGDAFHFSEGVASGFSRKDAAVVENPATRFVIESLQQALAGHLVSGDIPKTLGSTPMRCPRCAGLPVAAVLREEGHGGKRSLLCALCLHEWECLRLICPACGEQAFDKLPVYTAEQFAHVRVDGCDSCHHYIKTIDLTKDGLAVPCVDDIASVSLDLWARERGYTRIKSNLLGF